MDEVVRIAPLASEPGLMPSFGRMERGRLRRAHRRHRCRPHHEGRRLAGGSDVDADARLSGIM